MLIHSMDGYLTKGLIFSSWRITGVFVALIGVQSHEITQFRWHRMQFARKDISIANSDS